MFKGRDSVSYRLLMSTAGYTGNACELGLIDLDVICLTGEKNTFRVPPSMCGKEVRKLVSKQLPSKKGRTLALHHKGSPLLFHQTLQEQGIGQAAGLSCTFVPTNLGATWCFVKGLPTPDEEFAMEGLTHFEGATGGDILHSGTLPESLRSLTFGNFDIFNQTIRPHHGVTLTQLTQLLDATAGNYLQNLPQTLESLTFGGSFNQSMQGVTLQQSLHSLTFGYGFNHSMKGITLPENLRSLTFGVCFDQGMLGVTLPDSLQSLTFGRQFNQSMQGVTLPCSLQDLRDVYQEWERLSEVTSLQTNEDKSQLWGRTAEAAAELLASEQPFPVCSHPEVLGVVLGLRPHDKWHKRSDTAAHLAKRISRLPVTVDFRAVLAHSMLTNSVAWGKVPGQDELLSAAATHLRDCRVAVYGNGGTWEERMRGLPNDRASPILKQFLVLGHNSDLQFVVVTRFLNALARWIHFRQPNQGMLASIQGSLSHHINHVDQFLGSLGFHSQQWGIWNDSEGKSW